MLSPTSAGTDHPHHQRDGTRTTGVSCRAEHSMCTVGSERFHQPPPRPRSTEPGEWQHGWQHHASSSLEHHFRETVVLTQSCSADQAHLRSHSGPGTGEVLLGAPTGPEFRVEPQLFRTLVLERLRLPLDVTESKCECGCFLDTTGRHRQLARDLADSAQEQSVPKGLWPECAGKQGPQFASIPSSVI